jgi:hypothetical protein
MVNEAQIYLLRILKFLPQDSHVHRVLKPPPQDSKVSQHTSTPLVPTFYANITKQLLHQRYLMTVFAQETPKSHNYGPRILTYVSMLWGTSSSQTRHQLSEQRLRRCLAFCMPQSCWKTHTQMPYSQASLFRMHLVQQPSMFPMQRMYMSASSKTILTS